MKIITAEQIQMIREAKKSVTGTNEYYKYDMPNTFKDRHGKWILSLWSVPYVNRDCEVKTYRGKQYIMVTPESRYEMTDEVLELLGWK